jgi:uncharacterized protein with HEPN domain
VTRSDEERFADILNAIDRCESYKQYLRSDKCGSMAYDAVLRNLGVIGRRFEPPPNHAESTLSEMSSRSSAGALAVAGMTNWI